MDSNRFKEIMRTQVCYGAKNISLSFETAGQLYQALEQAEQAVQRVREVVGEDAPSFFTNEAMRAYDKAMSEITLALDGE